MAHWLRREEGHWVKPLVLHYVSAVGGKCDDVCVCVCTIAAWKGLIAVERKEKCLIIGRCTLAAKC